MAKLSYILIASMFLSVPGFSSEEGSANEVLVNDNSVKVVQERPIGQVRNDCLIGSAKPLNTHMGQLGSIEKISKIMNDGEIGK